MTTPLTIYGLGLCGNSVNESIGKHCFRTRKHQKVNKSSQRTTPRRFGYWRPGVRISTLRPKKEKRALAVLFSFFARCGWRELHSCEARRSIAARDIICSDYTCCTACKYLLLARQDTDAVGMRISHSKIEELALQAQSVSILP